MITRTSAFILLSATFLAGAAPARAEDPALAGEIAALRAQIQALEARLAQVEAARNAAPASPPGSPPAAAPDAPPAPTMTWRGAPQFEDRASGFSFRAKGFAQFDAGIVGTPGPALSGTVGGLNYNNLGWNARARRLVLGAEGSLPGGFGYNVEFNFAQATVGYEDIVLTYQRRGSPIRVTIGNFYPLSSLETMTSARMTSFLERASFTDAFNYNRRLGAAVALTDPANDRYTLTAGLFAQEIDNTSFNRTGWQASVRATYAPTIGDARLHLGVNFQHRVAQRDAQNVQLRARPFTQVTDQRFVDTGPIAADGDDIAGIELGAVVKSFHFAGEAQQLWVRGHRPRHMFGPNDGAGGGLFYAGDPSFFSAYAEAGMYLTGESRGYRGGRWDRPRVRHPFNEGGWGMLQANLRVDYLDLADRVGGAGLTAPDYVNGGRQTGYQFSLVWNPTDYLRFMAQYARVMVEGGPRAATVVPGSTDPVNRRDYSTDTVAVRGQIEF